MNNSSQNRQKSWFPSMAQFCLSAVMALVAAVAVLFGWEGDTRESLADIRGDIKVLDTRFQTLQSEIDSQKKITKSLPKIEAQIEAINKSSERQERLLDVIARKLIEDK